MLPLLRTLRLTGMSDLRFDPVTHQWVSIAENRRNRPVEFVPLDQVRHQMICPFCAGNEDETPAATGAFDKHLQPIDDSEEGTPWSVRVFPNKYQAFEANPDNKRATGPYKTSTSHGIQELIIPTARHVASVGELEFDEVKRALHVARLRIEQLKEAAEVAHAMLFLNCRMEAGASIEHVHFQLIGSPVLSQQLQHRHEIGKKYYEENHRTLISRIVDWECEQNVRLIRSSKNFAVMCPFASRLPLTVWIAAVDQPQSFVESGNMLDELAELCLDTVKRIESLLDRPAYNILLHQAPFGAEETDHWYLEIFPRLTRTAGYEWGTDLWVNPVAPETAAKKLRVIE